jgi:hypothetical protein
MDVSLGPTVIVFVVIAIIIVAAVLLRGRR